MFCQGFNFLQSTNSVIVDFILDNRTKNCKILVYLISYLSFMRPKNKYLDIGKNKQELE